MVFDPSVTKKSTVEMTPSDVFDPSDGYAKEPQEAAEEGIFDITTRLASRTAQKVKSAVTGRGRRREGVPELTQAQVPIKTAFGMLAATSPEQQRDVVAKSFPTATFEDDEYGNILVNIPDQGQFYINKPGLSQQDLLSTAGQGVAYIGAARGGAAPFNSLFGRAAGVGLASGGTSIGLDLAAQLTGSKQGVDLPRAGVTAAAGGAFELASPVFSSMWRFLTRGGKTPTVVEAREALKGLGYNVDELTDDAVNAFIREAKNASSPQSAATYAEAQTLPVKVPLKKGQITGRAQDQMFEDLAEKGAYGEVSETIMRGATQQTDDALRANVPEIQQRLGGGVSRVSEPGQGMGQVQSRFVKEADNLNKQVRAAYDAAETTTANIFPTGIKPLVNSLQTGVGRVLRNAPAVKGEIDDLGRLLKAKKPISVNEVFDWRRGMSDLSKNAPNATERLAAGRALRAFDDSIEDVIAGHLMNGDSSAASAWFDAISKRREYGKLFEGKDGADKLIASLVKKGEDGLTVDPQVASKFLFGTKGSKLINDPQNIRVLGTLKNRLGKNSEEWLALKEEAFLTIMQNSDGAYQGGQRGFSGVNLKKYVDNIKSRNPRVWNVLFDEEERKLLSQFVNVAARATNPVKGGSNTSNTAVGMSRMVQSLGDALFMGQRGKALLSRIFPTAYEGAQMGRAATAASGKLPLRQIPQGIAGGAGATVGSQVQE